MDSRPETGSRPQAVRAGRAPLLVFVLTLGMALWLMSGSWNESLLDRHEFRQTQTAISAYWLREAGLRLDYETPIFGPPWSVPLEFPVYQGSMAVLSRATGLSLESSGRLTSVFFFLAAIPAVLLLARMAGFGRSSWLVGAAVLATPVYLFYGRTVMIETCAMCLATWFMLALGRAARDRKMAWAAAAAVVGALAAMVKITTFAAFLPAAVLLAGWFGARGGDSAVPARDRWRWILIFCGGALAVSVLASRWWVGYSDQLKSGSPYASFLMSSSLGPWSIGPLALRFTGEFWVGVARNLTDYVVGIPTLGVLAAGALIAGRKARWLAGLAILLFLAGPLEWAAVYHYHDYYYCANAVLLMMGAGAVLAGAWDSARAPVVKWSLVGLFLGAQFLADHRVFADYRHGGIRRPPELAEAIRLTTGPGDVVVYIGWDWNTLLPYYAQRRAVLVPVEREQDWARLEEIIGRIPPDRRAGLVLHPDRAGRAEEIRQRLPMLDLAWHPTARSTDGLFYLRNDLEPKATATLEAVRFPEDTVQLPGSWNRLPAVDLSKSDLMRFSPRPVAGFGEFGLGLVVTEVGPVLLAHPRSELRVPVPPGATRLEASFGVLEAATRPDRDGVTDGITVEIFQRGPREAEARRLYRRELRPVGNPADRGKQTVTLAVPEAAGGMLFFRIGPGSVGNYAKDWAYWSSIELK